MKATSSSTSTTGSPVIAVCNWSDEATTTTRRPYSWNSPRGPSCSCRSPKSTSCRSTSAAARGARASIEDPGRPVGRSEEAGRRRRLSDLRDKAELIDIQAARAGQPGIAYPAEDNHWMAEVSRRPFPYPETPRPAPRDQGGGQARHGPPSADGPPDHLLATWATAKTEVAIRRDVQGGRRRQAGRRPGTRQPSSPSSTTGASPRGMAEFPYNVEAVSRFRPKSEGQGRPQTDPSTGGVRDDRSDPARTGSFRRT